MISFNKRGIGRGGRIADECGENGISQFGLHICLRDKYIYYSIFSVGFFS